MAHECVILGWNAEQGSCPNPPTYTRVQVSDWKLHLD